jgi:hypothetical protein
MRACRPRPTPDKAMSLIARLAHLPASDRRLVVRAAFSLIMARTALMLLELPRLRRSLNRRLRPLAAISAIRPEVSKIAWAVAAANRLFRYECLPIVLAAESMLLHLRLPGSIETRCGTRRDRRLHRPCMGREGGSNRGRRFRAGHLCRTGIRWRFRRDSTGRSLLTRDMGDDRGLAPLKT